MNINQLKPVKFEFSKLVRRGLIKTFIPTTYKSTFKSETREDESVFFDLLQYMSETQPLTVEKSNVAYYKVLDAGYPHTCVA